VRSRTSIVLCADISFSFYFSIQIKPYLRQQTGLQFEQRPYFLPNSLSVCQITHSPGSFRSHKDGSYMDLRTFTGSLFLSWPTVWILTMVITRPTFKSWPIRSGLQPHFQCSLFNSAFVVAMLTRVTGTPVDSTEDTKRQDLFSVSVRFWPLSQLLRSPLPFMLDFDLRETFFPRPSSRVLFCDTLQYRSFLDDFNTVWPSGDFRHNLHIFLRRFIFVTFLQSSTDIVCYGNILFSVSA